MTTSVLTTAALRVADLSQNSETAFDLRPNSADLDQIAGDLGLLTLHKLTFQGVVRSLGRSDWELVATLGATVSQPCVVTMDPVKTRIDTPVRRQYIKNYKLEDAPESEMPEDENVEPLGAVIDPAQVMIEALALALPLYPRKEGADLQQANFTKPGLDPMTDEDVRPFAGLAALRDAAKKDP
jgi:uncharacterized metal-binding protein YceD (DUF177 family)